MDARWLASGLHNLPHANVEWLSEVGDTDGVPDHHHHSAAIDRDLEEYAREHGEPYLWIVGNTGKHWVASQNDPGVEGAYTDPQGDDPLYGWYYDVHTRAFAAGIPLHNPETKSMYGLHWVIQPPWQSSHRHHEDYSMTGELVTEEEPDEYVMIDPDSGLVTRIRRMSSSPPHAIPPPASTTPDPLPWLDPNLTHGERKVVWLRAQRDAGVCEQPDGSNNGPEISTYHEATIRDGQPGFGKWLAKQGGNWCASSASAADTRTRIDSDPTEPLTPRASGLELENDAKANGTWRPSELAIRGEFRPQPGDIATMQRGKPGSWKRHVTTVVRDDPARMGCWCEGGNEGNRFGEDKFYKYSALLGFIERTPQYEGPVPYQGEDVVVEMPEFIISSEGTNPLIQDGDNALVLDGWDLMDPDPWIPEQWRGVKGHARRWRTTKGGVSVKGEPGPRRTKGNPITMGKRWKEFERELREAHDTTGVPIATIMATLQTESGGKADAERFEKHLGDWSFGLMQTLSETAFAIARQLDVDAPRKPIPRGGVVSEWRAFLSVPRNSILIGAAYIAYNDVRFKLLGDPILAAASYNAGSPRVKMVNPWGLVCTTGPTYDHCDVFSKWWGDTLEVTVA